MTEPVLLIPRFVKFTKRDNRVLGMMLESTFGSKEHPPENVCLAQEGFNVWPNIPLRGWTFTIPPMEAGRDYYVKAFHDKLGFFDVPPALFSALIFKYGNEALSNIALVFGYLQVGNHYLWTLLPQDAEDMGIARVNKAKLLGAGDLVEGEIYRVKGYTPSNNTSLLTSEPLRYIGIVCKGTIWERALFIQNYRLHFVPTQDLEVEAVAGLADLRKFAKVRANVVINGEFDEFFKQLQQAPHLAHQYGSLTKIKSDEDAQFIQSTFVEHVLLGAILGRSGNNGYHFSWGLRSIEYKKTKGGITLEDRDGDETLLEWQPLEPLFPLKQELFSYFKLDEPLDSKVFCLSLYHDYKYNLY